MRPQAMQVFVDNADMVGNPSALHSSGRAAKALLEDARESLATDVGAHPSEVIFTSGGSEADSIAVLGARRTGRDRVLVSAIEHPAVGAAVQRGLAEVIGVTRSGVVALDELTDRLDETVALVSVMSVNNETGIIQPVEEVAAAARRVGAWTHTDAVQALGRLPLDFASSGVDALSLSAHKVGGPVGIGALLVRRDVTLAPLGLGGGQERELRSGTQPALLAASFAAAVRAAVAERDALNQRLAGYFAQIAAALHRIGGVRLNTTGQHVPHVLNATFDAIRADDVLVLLDRAGIDASVGSACRAGVHRPSAVLLAMGRDETAASASLRFSMGHSTTQADVDALLAGLPDAVASARRAFD